MSNYITEQKQSVTNSYGVEVLLDDGKTKHITVPAFRLVGYPYLQNPETSSLLGASFDVEAKSIALEHCLIFGLKPVSAKIIDRPEQMESVNG